MNRPYLRHLISALSLVTTPASLVALGALAAVEERHAMRQIVTCARVLGYKAEQASAPRALLEMPGIEGGLLTAAGMRREIALHIDQAQRRKIITDFVENALVPVGSGFVEALVNRFLEQSRALAEAGEPRPLRSWTQRRLAQAMSTDLRLAGRPFQWLHKRSDRWQSHETLWDCAHVGALAWTVGDLPRVLVFDLLVPSFQTGTESNAVQDHTDASNGKNVDICLLHSTPEQYRSKTQRPRVVRDSEMYVALGELKGGIDPAGADEHWKTANAHLGRIRRSFAALPSMPQLFFVGNAIEASMAGEIWNQLESGELTNAANLTDDRQAVSLVSWLCSL